jgi:hypothetical protein
LADVSDIFLEADYLGMDPKNKTKDFR